MTPTPNTPDQNIARYGSGCLDAIGEHSSIWQDQRAEEGRVTLGMLINALGQCDPTAPVLTNTGHTLTNPHSHRGYYVDLAFEPTPDPQTVADLLALAGSALGTEYPGWKGGMFRKDHNTPVWVARRGECGRYLVAVTADADGVVLVTADENED